MWALAPAPSPHIMAKKRNAFVLFPALWTLTELYKQSDKKLTFSDIKSEWIHIVIPGLCCLKASIYVVSLPICVTFVTYLCILYYFVTYLCTVLLCDISAHWDESCPSTINNDSEHQAVLEVTVAMMSPKYGRQSMLRERSNSIYSRTETED